MFRHESHCPAEKLPQPLRYCWAPHVGTALQLAQTPGLSAPQPDRYWPAPQDGQLTQRPGDVPPQPRR